MSLEKIVSIMGQQGLYEVIATPKNRLIVEHLETKKRNSAFVTDNIVSIAEITVFGHLEDISLQEVFEKMKNFLKDNEALNHKESNELLRQNFELIWPEYDDQRVKDHDIKKIYQWYNLLNKSNKLSLVDSDKKDDENE